jgi:hypothetical protein
MGFSFFGNCFDREIKNFSQTKEGVERSGTGRGHCTINQDSRLRVLLGLQLLTGVGRGPKTFFGLRFVRAIVRAGQGK